LRARINKKELFTRMNTIEENPVRSKILDHYYEYAGQFDWNFDNRQAQIPTIPVIHATREQVALSIAATGFSALSTIDQGWYGKGVYFSIEIPYVLAYINGTPDPSILLGLLTPGKVYPVTEDPDGRDSLMGAPLMPFYNCHWVLTNKNGKPYYKNNSQKTITLDLDDFFTEIVIEQEAQIVPICIISLKREWVNIIRDI